MSAQIDYKFLKMLETVDRDISSAIDDTTSANVVFEVAKQRYLNLQSEWESICDYADNNHISTPLYWELISKIRDGLGVLSEFVAKSSSNQTNTIGNISNSTVIIGNNNTVKNKK